MALFTGLMLAGIILFFDAGFFGSCFEGSCGYMAMFIFAPAVALVALPIWWILLRQSGPMTLLILWFVLMLTVGFVIFIKVLWLCGLAGLGWLMWRQWQQHTQHGLATRDLFIRPR